MEHHPEVHGDCLLNGEPSGPESIRFGERGPLWIEFTVRTQGAHGAYVHATKSATKLAMRLAADLEELTSFEGEVSGNIQRAIELGRPVMDRMMGPGAGDLVSRVTLNIGTIRGGAKVNMVPSSCAFEADLRLPIGMAKADLLPKNCGDRSALPRSDLARGRRFRTLLVRSRSRDGRHHPEKRRSLRASAPHPNHQPRWHRCAALAAHRRASLCLRTLSARNGLA